MGAKTCRKVETSPPISLVLDLGETTERSSWKEALESLATSKFRADRRSTDQFSSYVRKLQGDALKDNSVVAERHEEPNSMISAAS